MTKEELHEFLSRKIMNHAAGARYGFSNRDLKVDNPTSPITELDYRIDHIALVAALVDAFAELGLVGH